MLRKLNTTLNLIINYLKSLVSSLNLKQRSLAFQGSQPQLQLVKSHYFVFIILPFSYLRRFTTKHNLFATMRCHSQVSTSSLRAAKARFTLTHFQLSCPNWIHRKNTVVISLIIRNLVPTETSSGFSTQHNFSSSNYYYYR